MKQLTIIKSIYLIDYYLNESNNSVNGSTRGSFFGCQYNRLCVLRRY